MSGEKVLLQKAEELAKKMEPVGIILKGEIEIQGRIQISKKNAQAEKPGKGIKKWMEERNEKRVS